MCVCGGDVDVMYGGWGGESLNNLSFSATKSVIRNFPTTKQEV